MVNDEPVARAGTRTRLRDALARARAAAGLLLAFAAFGAHAADWRIGPAPAWAKPVAFVAPPVATATSPGVAFGSRYDVVDDQVRLTDHGRATYHHVISEAVTEKGVDDLSHHEIEVDPAWEALVLHQVDIVREGHRVSRLRDMQVKVLQRERDLDSRIYDGRKTIELDLADVRPGDVLEIAYTRTGMNPVLGGHHFGGLDMQWSVPVMSLHRRLSTAANLAVRIALRNGAPEPALARVDGFDERTWVLRDVPALRREADTPEWYDPYQSVEWSDFATWADVARWAEPLYAVPPARGPALHAAIARIAQETPRADERVAAVLRLVQQQVRYLGVEIGAATHTPSPPDVVWARRWGDCKEKSLLVVTMLRALGIEADPALVNTVRENELARGLPSAGAFDHAITRVRLEGVDYWLDPTRSPQAGSLRNLTQVAYGNALVLDGRSAGLVPMPARVAGSRTREVDVAIDGHAGIGKPVGYVVRTTYGGLAADAMRDDLGDGERGEMQRRYVNYYAKSYPGIRVAAPLDVADDPVANTVVVTEHYLIDDFWTRDKQGRDRVSLDVPDMLDELSTPKEPIRVMPLALSRPHRLTEHVTMRLPEEWPAKDLSRHVSNAAFTFMRKVKVRGDLASMDYMLESAVDHVDAKAVRAYAADIDEARDELGWQLWKDRQPAQASASSTSPRADGWWIAVLALTLWFAASVFVRRRRESAAAAAAGEVLAHAAAARVASSRRLYRWRMGACALAALAFVGAASAIAGESARMAWGLGLCAFLPAWSAARIACMLRMERGARPCLSGRTAAVMQGAVLLAFAAGILQGPHAAPMRSVVAAMALWSGLWTWWRAARPGRAPVPPAEGGSAVESAASAALPSP